MSDIFSDRTSGSIEIVRKSLSFLEQLILYDRMEEARKFLDRLRETFPAMAAIINLHQSLQHPIDLYSIRQFECKLDASATIKQAVETFEAKQFTSFMTFSNSGIIELTLKKYNAKLEKVLCLESKPGGEGSVLCQRLQNKGIDASVVDDSAFEKDMELVDTVLIGCDCYCDYMLINKIGTEKLCHVAYKQKKPVYCLTSQIKWISCENMRNLPINEIFERIPIPQGVTVITSAAAPCSDNPCR